MSIETARAAVLDEKVWNAWLANSELREKAAARKLRIAGGILLILFIFAVAFYRMAAI